MGLGAIREHLLPNTKLVPRFESPTAEAAAVFRRADLVVLPYREIDQSGVLYSALAFGKPMLIAELGGGRRLAERQRGVEDARLVDLAVRRDDEVGAAEDGGGVRQWVR